MIRSQKKISEAQHPTSQLTQSDKLLLTYETSKSWAQTNRSIIYYVLGAIVLMGAGLYWYAGQKADNDLRASALLNRIVGVYASGDYRKAIDGDASQATNGEPLRGLRYIASEYGSTPSGNHAKLFLGNAYYFLGNVDSAYMAYDDGASEVPLLQAAFEAGKAQTLEDKNKKEDAAELYLKAAKRDLNNPFNGDYTLSAARDLRAAGKKVEAVKVYRQVLVDFPQSQFDDAAKRDLLEMDVDLAGPAS